MSSIENQNDDESEEFALSPSKELKPNEEDEDESDE